MKIGRFTITEVMFGSFRLDGGAMFGSVPKNLWEKLITPDSSNCIPLALRSIVITDGKRTFLVDVGIGEKWGEKQRSIFAIVNTPTPLAAVPAKITDIILTHLHFDHAGGISYHTADGQLALTYPDATVHLQARNLYNAQRPSLKERASYLRENIEPILNGNPQLLHGTTELYPGITVHEVDGHTEGQQWVEIHDQGESAYFATDLIPTAHHLPLAFQMGYDMCAKTVIEEKEQLLSKALCEDGWVIFQHDIHTAAARVGRDQRGQFCVRTGAEGMREALSSLDAGP